MGYPKIGKTRLEAFSDGVFAIIITIMVLELKVPHGDSIAALMGLFPVFLSYVLSFIYLAIYWNNHHHMIHTCSSVSGGILWANFHLLFWLSLIPFATGWMGENNFAQIPTQIYGGVLMMSGFAYYVLQNVIICFQGEESVLRKAVGRDWKGKLSVLAYALGILFGFVNPWISMAIYSLISAMWVVPDSRISKMYHV